MCPIFSFLLRKVLGRKVCELKENTFPNLREGDIVAQICNSGGLKRKQGHCLATVKEANTVCVQSRTITSFTVCHSPISQSVLLG